MLENTEQESVSTKSENAESTNFITIRKHNHIEARFSFTLNNRLKFYFCGKDTVMTRNKNSLIVFTLIPRLLGKSFRKNETSKKCNCRLILIIFAVTTVMHFMITKLNQKTISKNQKKILIDHG